MEKEPLDAHDIVCDCWPYFQYNDPVLKVRGIEAHHPLCGRAKVAQERRIKINNNPHDNQA